MRLQYVTDQLLVGRVSADLQLVQLLVYLLRVLDSDLLQPGLDVEVQNAKHDIDRLLRDPAHDLALDLVRDRVYLRLVVDQPVAERFQDQTKHTQTLTILLYDSLANKVVLRLENGRDKRVHGLQRCFQSLEVRVAARSARQNVGKPSHVCLAGRLGRGREARAPWARERDFLGHSRGMEFCYRKSNTYISSVHWYLIDRFLAAGIDLIFVVCD